MRAWLSQLASRRGSRLLHVRRTAPPPLHARLQPYWCCFSWGPSDREHRRLHYALPRPLAGASAPPAPCLPYLPLPCAAVPRRWLSTPTALLPRCRAMCCAGGWRPWETPSIQKAWPLEWCDHVSEADGNRAFTLLPQHPCAFLRNATAAALAARGSVAA